MRWPASGAPGLYVLAGGGESAGAPELPYLAGSGPEAEGRTGVGGGVRLDARAGDATLISPTPMLGPRPSKRLAMRLMGYAISPFNRLLRAAAPRPLRG